MANLFMLTFDDLAIRDLIRKRLAPSAKLHGTKGRRKERQQAKRELKAHSFEKDYQ